MKFVLSQIFPAIFCFFCIAEMSAQTKPDTMLIKRYYENGNLSEEASFKQGDTTVREGYSRWYHKNGKVEIEMPYTNHKRNGLCRIFYENGKLARTSVYEMSKLNGVSVYYYENGNPEIIMPYKDDQTDGLTRVFTPGGKLEGEEMYKNGQMEGLTKYYHSNGKIKIEMMMHNNQKVWRKDYDSNGKLIPEPTSKVAPAEAPKPDSTDVIPQK